jgi:hypothetical protein
MCERQWNDDDNNNSAADNRGDDGAKHDNQVKDLQSMSSSASCTTATTTATAARRAGSTARCAATTSVTGAARRRCTATAAATTSGASVGRRRGRPILLGVGVARHKVDDVVWHTDVLDARAANVDLWQLPELIARLVGAHDVSQQNVHPRVGHHQRAVVRFAALHFNQLVRFRV